MRQRSIGFNLLGCVALLFLIVPCSASETLTLLGTWSRPEAEAMSLALSGGYAYVGIGNSGGMYVLDVSDRENPSDVAFVGTPGPRAESSAAASPYLYVADDVSGVRVVDISEPTAAHEVGWADTPGDATGIAVAGSYAYVADFWDGLRVIDISDPASPHEVASLPVPLTAFDVVVSGALAYLVYGEWPQPQPGNPGGLLVVNIADPVHPQVIASCAIQGQAHALAVRGQLAYVASYPYGLYVLDVSQPEHPSLIGSCATGGQAFDVAVWEDRAYVAALVGGVRLVDISHPTQPVEIGACDTPGTAFQVTVDPSGGYLYLADGSSGVEVYSLGATRTDIVFQDDFSSAVIDPGKWLVYGCNLWPQEDALDPWWQHTYWDQADSIGLRVTHENWAEVHARSVQRFTEGCTSYEVEVWQDDVSGWQDWPINFFTPYGKFGYYNFNWHWTVEWTGAGGEKRIATNVFPEAMQPWTHYRLKVAREEARLCWYIDNNDGTGYRLVYSTDDFRFPFMVVGHLLGSVEPVYHIWLTNTDLGTTYYDNVIVHGTLGALREGIVFVSDRSGNREIWVMEADGSNPTQLTTDPGVDDTPVPSPPNFFPTGNVIAYISEEGNAPAGPGELPHTNIWIMNPDGSEKRPLTNEQTAYCSQPQWSPRGDYIVYVKKRQGEAAELWRVNVATGTDRRLTTAGVTHKNPEWCGGYQTVYDQDTGGGGWWELFAMDPNGANPRPLATGHHSISPAVSHGGSKPYGAAPTSEIAYVRVLGPTSQVRAVRADGANDRLIHDNSAIAYDGWGQVAWSPDDSLLAASIYPSLYPGVPEFESFIEILDPATGAELYRTTQGRNTFALESSRYDDFRFSAGDRVWNETSARLAFMSDRDGNWEIYAMNPDGTGQENLTQNAAWDGNPCWITRPGEPSAVLEVEIDIKPGSECNPVNPKSQGVLPVAVFSSADFDATDINPSTVQLAGAVVAQNPDDGKWMMQEQDENGDGLLDVRLHFDTEGINVAQLAGDYATLTGSTFGGVDFEGRDMVTIVPKDIPNDHWAIEPIAECLRGNVVKGYPDGSYLPNVSVSRAQMAAFVSRAHAGGADAVPEGPEDASFPDVPTDHWAYDSIEYAVANGIVTGYAGGTYQPGWIVTRAQMAVFIARAEEWVDLEDDLATAPKLFPDVPAGYWAGTAIEVCVANEVVKGYLDGFYRPTWEVTRDQMAAYIARAFELPT